MPVHPRSSGGDPAAAGRGRQRLKIFAIGYFNARHGVDADLELARAARKMLDQAAIEYAEAVSGSKRRWAVDLSQGDDEMLCLAAIAYTGARHGIDADVGMAREGMAILCQAAIEYDESFPREEVPKRSSNTHFQIGEGAR